MDTMGAQDLAARVARLEATIHRQRIVGLGVLAILFATAQTSSSTQPFTVQGSNGSVQVTGSGVSVRDSGGQQRVFIGLDSGGRPSIDLRDSTGTLRQSMFLVSDNSAPTLRQYDSSGNTRMEQFLTKDGFPDYRLLDDKGKRRLAVFIGYDTGNPEVAVYGSDEEPRGYLVGPDCGAYFEVRDANKNFRAHMGTYPDCDFGLFLRNAAGQNQWAVP